MAIADLTLKMLPALTCTVESIPRVP